MPIPKRGTRPEIQPKNVLMFTTETLQRGMRHFWKNLEHLSEVSKRRLFIKSIWEQNGRETDENHFWVSQIKFTSQRRCTWSYHVTLEETTHRKKNKISLSKWTFCWSFSSLGTNEGRPEAWSFLPLSKHPILWFSSYGKIDVDVKGRFSSTQIWTKRRTQIVSPHF